MKNSIITGCILFITFLGSSCNSNSDSDLQYTKMSGTNSTNWVGTYEGKLLVGSGDSTNYKLQLLPNLTYNYTHSLQHEKVDSGIIEWIDGRKLRLIGKDTLYFQTEKDKLQRLESTLVGADATNNLSDLIKIP